MKKIFLFIILLLTVNISDAFQIVYPAKSEVVINSQSTFFVGHTDDGEILKINDEVVETNDLGYFAHTVKLNNGKNLFTVIGRENKAEYIINVPSIQPVEKPIYNEFDVVRYAYVKYDNAPLRSTPIDGGINRISHLQKGINLFVVGEYGDFYRVKLTDNEYAWIDKRGVEFSDDNDNDLSTVFDYRHCEDDNYEIYEFYLMKKVPFKIEENPFKLTIYNLKNSKGYFTVKPQINHRLAGYKISYEGDKLVLKIRKFPALGTIKPLDKITIAVDAGHGGSEYGAIGCSGTAEKDINLIISNYLKKYLKHLGANVLMTREDDSYSGLYDRVKFANDNDAVIFISIHANATPDSWNPNEHSGTSAYYYYGQAKPLAESILKSVNELAETNNDGIYQRSFAVVRNHEALSVLVEMAYMINPEDIAKLEQTYFQKKVAKGIARGILNFMKDEQSETCDLENKSDTAKQ